LEPVQFIDFTPGNIKYESAKKKFLFHFETNTSENFRSKKKIKFANDLRLVSVSEKKKKTNLCFDKKIKMTIWKEHCKKVRKTKKKQKHGS